MNMHHNQSKKTAAPPNRTTFADVDKLHHFKMVHKR